MLNAERSTANSQSVVTNVSASRRGAKLHPDLGSNIRYSALFMMARTARQLPPPKAQNAVINSNRGVSSRRSGLNPLIIYCQDQPPFALALRSVDLPGADPMLDKP